MTLTRKSAAFAILLLVAFRALPLSAAEDALSQLRDQAADLGLRVEPFQAAPTKVIVARSVAAASGTKLAEAASVIKSLTRKDGFFAGNDYRQYWTRDLGYSLKVLIGMGYADLVEAQFNKILGLQRADGNLPARAETLEGKIQGFFGTVPQTLRTMRYRGRHAWDESKDNASDYRHGEADNPVIFMTSVKTFERLTGREVSRSKRKQLAALDAYIRNDLLDKSGLLLGSGWTDAMTNYKGKNMLHIQVWLYIMDRELGRAEDMARVKSVIESFWDAGRGYYTDYRGGTRFDTLGDAMLLEEGLVPPAHVPAVLDALTRARTPYGYVNLYPAYPFDECTQYPHQYQNRTIWPFIEYHVAAALLKYGRAKDARELMAVMDSRRGMNEWYSPVDGRPDGSPGQLWTAAAVVGVHQLLDGPR